MPGISPQNSKTQIIWKPFACFYLQSLEKSTFRNDSLFSLFFPHFSGWISKLYCNCQRREKKNVSFSSTVATVSLLLYFHHLFLLYPGERKLLLQMVAKMLQQQFMLLQHQQQQPQLQQQQQHQQRNKIWKFFISLTRSFVDIFSAVTVLWPSQTQKNPLWVLLSFRAKTEKQKKTQIIFCTHTDTTHRDIHSNIKTHTHTHTHRYNTVTHTHT